MVHAQIQCCDVIQCHHKPRQISNAVITQVNSFKARQAQQIIGYADYSVVTKIQTMEPGYGTQV